MDKHHEVDVCPFPIFGKFGKHIPAVATPLGNSPIFVQAKGNEDVRSAQAVQDSKRVAPLLALTRRGRERQQTALFGHF